ncbi:hypothetical protein [Rhodanobacter lindaniclasticus]
MTTPSAGAATVWLAASPPSARCASSIALRIGQRLARRGQLRLRGQSLRGELLGCRCVRHGRAPTRCVPAGMHCADRRVRSDRQQGRAARHRLSRRRLQGNDLAAMRQADRARVLRVAGGAARLRCCRERSPAPAWPW